MIQEDFYIKKKDEEAGDLPNLLSRLNVDCSVQDNGGHKENKGYFVVEEIAEGSEPCVPESESIPSVNIVKGSIGDDMGAVAAALETVASSAPVEHLNQSRREFGNISPISEDMSQSDTDDTNVPNNSLNSEATPELSFVARLNCSSPILAHSPSLRKTPILPLTPGDTATPPSTGAGKRVRNFARALDDIPDHEGEDNDSLEESEDSDSLVEAEDEDSVAEGDDKDSVAEGEDNDSVVESELNFTDTSSQS